MVPTGVWSLTGATLFWGACTGSNVGVVSFGREFMFMNGRGDAGKARHELLIGLCMRMEGG